MKARNLKHRPVIEIEDRKDIAQEPEMQSLKEVLNTMTEAERTRTINHLKEVENGK
jgi:hypothetical protein